MRALSLKGPKRALKLPAVELGRVRLSQQYLEVLNSGGANKVRLSQQYLEVINSGATNKVRLSQQYAEIINSGGNNKVRLSQQYLEVIHTFGTPPPEPPGKKGKPPGQEKKESNYLAAKQHRRLRREVQKSALASAAFIPAQYLSPGSGSSNRVVEAVDWRTSTRRISISPSGHTVKKD